jgi:protein-S-isoprenylcysteine O-methyltransferase Ste14
VSDSPGFRPPPPFYFALAFAAGAGLHWLAPVPLPREAWIARAGWVLAASGGVLAVGAVLTMVRARTTYWYHRPATALVTGGPYRFTRNPMYLSLALLYLATCLIASLAWPLATLPLAIAAVQARYIRVEERFLRERFGKEYDRYTRRVRRWL